MFPAGNLVAEQLRNLDEQRRWPCVPLGRRQTAAMTPSWTFVPFVVNWFFQRRRRQELDEGYSTKITNSAVGWA